MKMVKELSYKEIKEIVMNNDDLRKELIKLGEERAIGEDGDVWLNLNDYLYGIPARYEIANYGYDYIRFERNYGKIVGYLRGLQRTYEFLYDEQGENNAKIDKLDKYGEVLDRADYGEIEMKDKDYAAVEEIVDDLIEYFEGELLRRMQNEIDYFYNDENCLDFILEYTDELDIFEDMAVTDDLRTIFYTYDMV